MIQKNVSESFNFGNKDNTILRQQSEIIKFSGVDIYPGVTLNNIKMKGSLTG